MEISIFLLYFYFRRNLSINIIIKYVTIMSIEKNMTDLWQKVLLKMFS